MRTGVTLPPSTGRATAIVPRLSRLVVCAAASAPAAKRNRPVSSGGIGTGRIRQPEIT